MNEGKPNLGHHQRSNSNVGKKITIQHIDYDSVANMSSITNPIANETANLNKKRRTVPLSNDIQLNSQLRKAGKGKKK